MSLLVYLEQYTSLAYFLHNFLSMALWSTVLCISFHDPSNMVFDIVEVMPNLNKSKEEASTEDFESSNIPYRWESSRQNRWRMLSRTRTNWLGRVKVQMIIKIRALMRAFLVRKGEGPHEATSSLSLLFVGTGLILWSVTRRKWKTSSEIFAAGFDFVLIQLYHLIFKDKKGNDGSKLQGNHTETYIIFEVVFLSISIGTNWCVWTLRIAEYLSIWRSFSIKSYLF